MMVWLFFNEGQLSKRLIDKGPADGYHLNADMKRAKTPINHNQNEKGESYGSEK